MTVLKKIFSVSFAAFFGFAALLMLFLQNAMLAGFFAAAAVAFFCYKSRFRRFGLVLFLAALVTRAVYAVAVDTPAVSDFYWLHRVAEQWLDGDLRFGKDIYFRMWAYQLPFVSWNALLSAICPGTVLHKLAGAVFMAGSALLVYKIARAHWSEGASRSAAGIYFVQLFPWSLASVLTNQHISAFFFLLAVWLIVSTEVRERLGMWRWALAGLAAALGEAFRPEGMLLLIALAAYVVFLLIKEHKSILPTLKKVAVRAVCFLLVYALVLGGFGVLMNALGVSTTGIANGNPLWKFVVGLNHDTAGTYSAADFARLIELDAEYGLESDELREFELGLIRERISVPPQKLLNLFYLKIKRVWTSSELNWSLGHWDSSQRIVSDITLGTLVSRLEDFDLGARTVMYAFALAAVASFFTKKRPKDLAALIPPFLAFAAFCAFLFIEVQGRYSYLPILFIAITAAGGIDTAVELARDRFLSCKSDDSVVKS